MHCVRVSLWIFFTFFAHFATFSFAKVRGSEWRLDILCAEARMYRNEFWICIFGVKSIHLKKSHLTPYRRSKENDGFSRVRVEYTTFQHCTFIFNYILSLSTYKLGINTHFVAQNLNPERMLRRPERVGRWTKRKENVQLLFNDMQYLGVLVGCKRKGTKSAGTFNIPRVPRARAR